MIALDSKWKSKHRASWKGHISTVRSREMLTVTAAEVAKHRTEPFSVWLGGPCKKGDLRPMRELLRECLEMDGFKVIYSEDARRMARIRSMEVNHVGSCDLAILPLISPGTIAEAFDFMQHRAIKGKIQLFAPIEYKKGYACRSSLEQNFLSPESMFSLDRLSKGSTELLEAVWRMLDDARSTKYLVGRP